MTEEQNPPQAQSHEAAPSDMSTQQGQTAAGAATQGQARNRRRRRKRKGAKGGPPQAGASQNGAGSDDQLPLLLASESAGEQTSADTGAQPRSQNNGQTRQQKSGGGQGSGQGSSQGSAQGFSQGQGQAQGQQPQGRKAKKFRKKSRSGGGGASSSRNENPGNQINASPGNGGQGAGRRRTKQRRGPEAFVGPMDHSYRAVNGNFADTPPSTIEMRGSHRSDNYGNTHGNGNGGGYSSYAMNGNSSYAMNGNGHGPDVPYSDRPSVPPHPDAPVRIVCFIDDLFFIAKIQETARKLGVKVAFVKADKDIVSQLAGEDEASRPGLIVFDLNNLNAKPLTLIPKLKAKLKKGTSIVGFLSHLQGDLKMKATEAGCDTVMPRSAFSQNLPNLLRRYGLVDELESVEQ